MPNGFNNRPNIGQQVLDSVTSNVSGVFSTRPSAKYLSGARTILKVNGKIVGFAFGVSWNIRTQYAENNTIDDPLVNEFIPQRMAVDGTISALHIPGSGPGVENWQGDVLSFLFNQYISIEVRDSKTNDLMFLTNKAVIVSRSEEVRVDSLANVTLAFRAIGWRDEKAPEYPQGIQESSPNSDSQLKNVPGSRLDTTPNQATGSIKNLIG